MDLWKDRQDRQQSQASSSGRSHLPSYPVDRLSSLKASDIKKVLDAGGVDYRDCLEKRELVQRLQENQTYIPKSVQATLQSLVDKKDDTVSEPAAVTREVAEDQAGLSPPGYIGGYLEAERNSIRLFTECGPSVVNIGTTRLARGGRSMSLLEVPQGTGSGFIWDRSGHVVTNFHVIMNTNGKAQVALADGSSYEAHVVGKAPNKDLAVLKIDAPPDSLHPIQVGTSQSLQVGQHVLAIGNPFGLDRTLTSGIVSGVGRDIRGISGQIIRGVIQSDAAINPGNSGGPLLDSQGRLIGVNTMIYSPSGASAGVGFAIPVDTVRRTVNQLIREGRATQPGLGVTCAPHAQSRQLGLKGALVMAVLSDSGAEEAGVRGTSRDEVGRIVLGDIITAINGEPTATVEDVLTALEEYNVGDTVRVSIKRGSGTRDVYIRLREIEV